jgi:hypothetical protein
MKESYGEDLANHTGLKPYAEGGDILGVASVRGTGRPAIELRNQSFRASTLLCQGEDNMHAAALARQYAARRSRRP